MDEYENTKLFLCNVFQIPPDYQIPSQVSFQVKEILLNLIVKINKIPYLKPKSLTFMKGIGNIKLSSFYENVTKEMQKELNDKSYNHQIYDFILPSGRQIYLYIITEKKDNRIDSSSLYNSIYVWLHFIDNISKNKCCQLLNIYIILDQNTRQIPNHRFIPLQSKNINSGFTFTCKENNDIFIYRKEEAFKVFIHESFHSFHLDFSNMDQKMANEKIKETFQGIHGKQDLRIYEAYTEFWAEIINILLLNKKETSVNFHKINECIFYERLWSIFQCGKILHHYNLELKNLFIKDFHHSSSSSSSSSSFGYETNTFPFSYFLLKAICFENINDFILFCHKENNDLINFTHTTKNITTFCHLVTNIKETKTNLGLINGLDKINKWFSNGKIKSNQNYLYFLKTLRMSMYG